MAAEQMWKSIPLQAPLYTNVDETALRNGWPAIENAYSNEARGHSRFPGFAAWKTLDTGGRVYLKQFQDDLFAITSLGRVYRIGSDATAYDVTGVLVTGGRRPTFAPTEEELIIAAGGPMVAYREPTTRKLSDQAPNSTHIVYVDGYLIGNEPGSARFRITDPGDFASWPVINTFTAEQVADKVTSISVNDFGEVMIGGPRSIEQWERNPGGSQPFFKRWLIAAGLAEPYLTCAGDNAHFIVNHLLELARISGQLAQAVSIPVQRTLEGLDDTSEAWMNQCNVAGQRFIVAQFPNATNPYGTKGVTLLHDYRQRRFSMLYGFDSAASAPGRWPGWSIEQAWHRTFVGGDDGQIYELDAVNYAQDAGPMIMLGRSGHWDPGGLHRCCDTRIRLKRGQATGAAAGAAIQLRVNRDNMGWSSFLNLPIGEAGDRRLYARTGPLGNARTWQFEYRVSHPSVMEITGLEILIERIGR